MHNKSSCREGWRRNVWSSDEANAYSRALQISSYVSAVVPDILRHVGMCPSVLDVGAGDGRFSYALTRWGDAVTAVEPCAAMRPLLRKRLRGRRTTFVDAPWWRFPELRKGFACGIAANVGAFKTAPNHLYARMRAMCQHMAWVVPAQQGPSSFCLSGIVSDWLGAASERPVYLSLLESLRPYQRPQKIIIRDWVFRRQFQNIDVATDALRQWLAVAGKDVLRPDVLSLIGDIGVRDDVGRVTLECPKRSAILLWI